MNKETIQEKKARNPYKVRNNANSTKDVDMTKRVATGFYNTFFYIDSDLDMLLPGCAAKSIQERGAGSKKGNKIKHLKDHDWYQVTARIDVIDERKEFFNGRELEGIYHESYYSQAKSSDDILIKIQEGLYDSRSIGFRYSKIEAAAKESEDESELKNWANFYPKALNPEVADEFGFFWVVKEIMLFEGSDVAFGANQLTPLLGMKSTDKKALLSEAFAKMDAMQSMIKNGNMSDDGQHQLEMEFLQLKTYMNTIAEREPNVKDTLIKSREDADTQKKQKQDEVLNFYKSLVK